MRTVTLAAAALAIGVIAFIGCTASPIGATSDAPSSVGAAIAAAFSTGQGGSVLGPQAVNTTCSDFEPGGGGPSNVTTSASITAGTYGASANSVTVTADQDCESDSDSNDSFAGFTISQDVPGTCADGTTVTLLSGSTGIFRNNDAESYFPEIYGTFNVRDDDGTEYTGIKCTIFIDGNQTVVSATCEDSSGATIDTSNSTTCQFDTDS